MEKIKVLLFSSNPPGTDPLDLSREFREIDEEIRYGEYRDGLDLIYVPAARSVDLLRWLNKERPQIVHFSGHGTEGAVLLEADEADDPHAAKPLRSGRDMQHADLSGTPPDRPADRSPAGSQHGLVDVLKSCNAGNIQVVVLNACHSRSLASAIGETINCVVSMDQEISDRSAIKFAASFYGALAFGRSVQSAFDQAVARLKAENTLEELTPRLLVRPGIDAQKLNVLTPPSPVVEAALPVGEPPFTVPFPQNADFVGRDQDLEMLHSNLLGKAPVGIRPAGLTGMGGIGKTQLAVEYAYRYRSLYPGGIFWVNAAEPLVEGFAGLGRRMRPEFSDHSRDEQVRAAFEELKQGRASLLIVDNLAEPAELNRPVASGCIPSALECRTLFTTRRRDLGRFSAVEVTVLPEEPALRLLLRHSNRQEILDPGNPFHQDARAICRMLGMLPLALELAGAFLGEWGDIPLADYRERLKREGILATLDDEAAELPAVHLPAIHDAAVTATLSSQWEALQDETARLLLRVAGQLPEAATIPVARLGLLAGVPDQDQPGRPSPLARALKRLETASLVEELLRDQLRLHPLVREFAVRQTPPSESASFRVRCASVLVDTYSKYAPLESQVCKRGIDSVEEDMSFAVDLSSGAADVQTRAESLLRLVQREAGNLRSWDPSISPSFLPQQVYNRAMVMGPGSLQVGSRQRLSELGQPCACLAWRASNESATLVRTLLGHQGEINHLVMTGDGRRILSASLDCTVKLWDLGSGRELQTYAGHTRRINDLVLTSDETKLVSASSDRLLNLWDLQTGQLLHTFQGHEDWVTAVAVTPDGRWALSGSEDYSLLIWDLERGKLECMLGGHEGGVSALRISADGCRAISASISLKLWDLGERRELLTMQGHSDWVNDLLMLPDEHCVLSASSDGTLRLWDLHTGEQVRKLDCGKGDLTRVALCPDGLRALSASSNGSLYLWDLASGELLRRFRGHSGKVGAVAITTDGRKAVTASSDCTLRIWDLEGVEEPRQLIGHEDRVSALKLTPDGRHAVSASSDRSIKIWDLSPEQSDRIRPKLGHGGSVRLIEITADGLRALSCATDRSCVFWDILTGDVLQSFWTPYAWNKGVAISPDGHYAICGAADGVLRVLNLDSGRSLSRFKEPRGPINVVRLTRKGDRVISGSSDHTIRVWDFATGEEIHVLKAHESGVKHLALTDDDRRLVSAGSDGSIRVWDWEQGRELTALAAHDRSVNALRLTPDGRCSVSASSDGTVVVWPFEDGRAPVTLPGSSRVNDVAVSPNGTQLISASADAILRLWDLQSGKLIRGFTGHQGRVWSVRLTGDGRYACSTSFDRELRIWDVQSGACLTRVPIEGSPTCLAVARDELRILVGGGNGNIYCFTLDHINV
jgi:WD40 repeat protein